MFKVDARMTQFVPLRRLQPLPKPHNASVRKATALNTVLSSSL